MSLSSAISIAQQAFSNTAQQTAIVSKNIANAGNADYSRRLALLGSTGQASPADLAARFGLDLRRPEFWQASLAVIEQRIDQYVART